MKFSKFIALLLAVLTGHVTFVPNASAGLWSSIFAQPVTLGDTDEFFSREGMQREPQMWEDGIREPTGAGHYEWWYFDAILDDGSSVVLTYLTKPVADIQRPLTPTVYIDIKGPDGTPYGTQLYFAQEAFTSSDEKCDVNIGGNTASGDLTTYVCHASGNGLEADLTFTGTVPAWRPGVGKYYFGRKYDKYFGWLPSVPYGTVQGTLTYGGKTVTVKGTGYHDHNWGNAPLTSLIDHWYWGRTHVGDYTAIYVQMTATAKYGYAKMPVFMLAKGSEIIADDQSKLALTTADMVKHEGSRNYYPRETRFLYSDGDDSIVIDITSPELVNEQNLLETFPPLVQKIALLLVNPFYLRFHADMKLTIDYKGVHDVLEDLTVFEIMIFSQMKNKPETAG